MQPTKQIELPLGKITGLCAFCVTTLVGVWAGNDPEIIAARSCGLSVAAAVAGYLIARLFVSTPGSE